MDGRDRPRCWNVNGASYTQTMVSGPVTRTIGRAASHVPGIRKIPVVYLISVAEIGLLAHNHLMRLTPDERRRLIALVRAARGRPSKLDDGERDELAHLVAKLEPRLLAGQAVGKISPVWLPKRVTEGSRKVRNARAKA